MGTMVNSVPITPSGGDARDPCEISPLRAEPSAWEAALTDALFFRPQVTDDDLVSRQIPGDLSPRAVIHSPHHFYIKVQAYIAHTLQGPHFQLS